MTKKINRDIDSDTLRQQAEQQLEKNRNNPPHPISENESSKLHHELQVHQIELEMQNDELRLARDELENSLKKYTDIYDFAPVGYSTLDCIGVIRSINLTGARLIGVERSLLVGRRFGQYISAESRTAFNAFLKKVCKSSITESCEVELQKEGHPQISLQVEGVATESGQECRLALIDITERKRFEKALNLANVLAEKLRLDKEKAEAMVHAKSQFLAHMSHELRTPMTGILGTLQLALEENMTPVLRDYLETTHNSSLSLLRILNDILDMAKFETGTLNIENKPFSIQKCILDAVDTINPEAKRKGLDIVCSVSGEVPDKVFGDQNRLKQVLINFISNAVKFTEVGKVEVNVTAGIWKSSEKREFTFTVTDTGIGIPNDKNELIFKAFCQVDPFYSRSYGGTGLGLAISKEIVELMGGTISFVSNEGVGSTFSCTIPFDETGLEFDAQSATESLPLEVITTSQERANIPRLLLVDDDPVVQQILGIMLKRAKFDTDFAGDGLKAIELWGKGCYDLIIMDVQMPRLNGYEATRTIRMKEKERGGHTPIIAMTAHASNEDKERCLSAGMDAYLSKPIKLTLTLKVIEDLLRQTAIPSPD